MKSLIVIVCLFFMGCSWSINGIQVEDFKSLTSNEKAMIVGGMFIAPIVHEIGHGINQNKPNSGFITQLALGALFKISPWRHSYLVTGYHMGTAAEIWSYYPMQRVDIRYIEDNEMVLYNIIAGLELLNTKKDKGN